MSSKGKKCLTVAVAFSALFGASVAQAQSVAENDIKQLLATEQALLDGIANGDKDLWDRHMHDSCIVITEDGSTRSKKQFLDELTPLPPGYVGKLWIRDPVLQLHGNTAVLSFVDDEALELFGQKIHTRYRQSDTWIMSDGEWKMILMTLFEIPKNPPPITVDASIIEKYSGMYYLSAERACSVYVVGDNLFARKGEREPQRLFAETQDVFFREGDGRVNVIFRKNAAGLYEMVERREGEDLVWKPSLIDK